uniref:Reverse transcriptase Ty1/copia-type domain-containing protein n=1 Tax=Nicotiana tabacum TaxID=4097 RepID=A0A1S4CMU1_TOBAC|nr:PREDICTED: uncharacterized protein LOC107820765 [Nicotiana tabacum]
MNCFSAKLLSGIVYSSNVCAIWNELKEQFDKIDCSRIFQIHKQIAMIRQRTISVATYISKLLWAEFDCLALIPGCDCAKSREFVIFMERLKLLKFLMGLNESYERACSQILMMVPVPTLNKAYSMLTERENQRSIYPIGYKPKKRFGNNTANNVKVEEHKGIGFDRNNSSTNVAAGLPTPTTYFTPTQYNHILKLLNNIVESSANMTGAINHMISHLTMLFEKIKLNNTKKVHLPNGSVTDVSHVGSCHIVGGLVNNYLYTNQVREIGNEDDGLYLLPQLSNENAIVSAKSLSTRLENMDIGLWHRNLNEVAERKHMHVLKVTRAIRFEESIPLKFWGHCVLAATYIINRMPSTVLKSKSSYKVLRGKKPTLIHLRALGCLCYAKRLSLHDKFAPRAMAATMMGYSEGCMSRENVLPFKHQSAGSSQLFLDDSAWLSVDHASPVTNLLLASADHTPQAHTAVSPNDSTDVPIRHSQKNKQQPVWMADFIIGPKSKSTTQPPHSIHVSIVYDKPRPSYKQSLAVFTSIVKPKIFHEASKDPLWIEAMQTELKALEDNKTWELVALPPGKVHIGCKWVYKVKYKANVDIERYKFRLVSKGYSQQKE